VTVVVDERQSQEVRRLVQHSVICNKNLSCRRENARRVRRGNVLVGVFVRALRGNGFTAIIVKLSAETAMALRSYLMALRSYHLICQPNWVKSFDIWAKKSFFCHNLNWIARCKLTRQMAAWLCTSAMCEIFRQHFLRNVLAHKMSRQKWPTVSGYHTVKDVRYVYPLWHTSCDRQKDGQAQRTAVAYIRALHSVAIIKVY